MHCLVTLIVTLGGAYKFVLNFQSICASHIMKLSHCFELFNYLTIHTWALLNFSFFLSSCSYLQITCNSRETLFKQPRVLHKGTTYLFAYKSRWLIICVWSTELIQKGCISKRFLIPFLKPFNLVSHTFSSIHLLTTSTCSVGYHMTYFSNW